MRVWLLDRRVRAVLTAMPPMGEHNAARRVVLGEAQVESAQEDGSAVGQVGGVIADRSRSPRLPRIEPFKERAEDGEMERCFQRVEWFRKLPPDQMQGLIRSAKHKTVCLRTSPRFGPCPRDSVVDLRLTLEGVWQVPRWHTIIREGVEGNIFYLLLKGSVQVTSASGVNLTLPCVPQARRRDLASCSSHHGPPAFTAGRSVCCDVQGGCVVWRSRAGHMRSA